jgi:hypothetical protein
VRTVEPGERESGQGVTRREVEWASNVEVHFWGPTRLLEPTIANLLQEYPPAQWGTWVSLRAPRRGGEHIVVSRQKSPLPHRRP